jgi:hypothetical protein
MFQKGQVTARFLMPEVRKLKQEKWRHFRQGVGLPESFHSQVEALRQRGIKLLQGEDAEIFQRALEEI